MEAKMQAVDAKVESDDYYASFGRRFVAWIIDSSLILFISYAIINILSPRNAVLSIKGFSGKYEMIIFIISWLYYAKMESSRSQATVGKIIMGIKVVGIDFSKISFGRASGRFLGKIISDITFCIGYIMAAFTSKKQALHDKLANCLVIYDIEY